MNGQTNQNTPADGQPTGPEIQLESRTDLPAQPKKSLEQDGEERAQGQNDRDQEDCPEPLPAPEDSAPPQAPALNAQPLPPVVEIVSHPTAKRGQYLKRSKVKKRSRRNRILSVLSGLMALGAVAGVIFYFPLLRNSTPPLRVAPQLTEEPQYRAVSAYVDNQQVTSALLALGEMDEYAQSGREDVFSVTHPEIFTLPPGEGAVTLLVDGLPVARLASYEEGAWAVDAALGAYGLSPNGALWKRNFTQSVTAEYSDSTQGLIPKEEALLILREALHVQQHEKVFEEEIIEFKLEYIEDGQMAPGETKLLVSGENGVRQVVKELVTVDGRQQELNLMGTRTTLKPVNMVIMRGPDLDEGPSIVQLDGTPTPKPAATPKPQVSAKPSATPKPTAKPTATARPTPTPDMSAFIPVEQPQDQAVPTEDTEPDVGVEIVGDEPSSDFEVPLEPWIPEAPQAPQVTQPPAQSDSGSWPSSSYSAFNYPSAGNGAWYSDSSMGAGKNYPNLDFDADSETVSTQGIGGPGGISFSWPVDDKNVTSHFGWRKKFGRIHYGIDIADSRGTPVYASARGTVTWYTKDTANNGSGYGKVVEINHGKNFTTIYGHLDSLTVGEGDHVEKGQLIGYMGNTEATGVHLHFEIRCEGIPYNPLLGYLAW